MARSVLAGAVIAAGLFPASSLAQATDARAPLEAGCANFAPYCTETEPGVFEGFVPDLYQRLSEITGIEIRQRSLSRPEIIEQQASGSLQITVASQSVLPLRATNVGTIPVAEERAALYVLRENFDRFGSGDLSGQRIALVERRGLQDTFIELLGANEVIPARNNQETIVLLLSGGADAALFSVPAMEAALRNLRLENQIVLAGPSVAADSLVVHLHESRADLLDPVNAAIRELDERGELTRLQELWSLVPPEPEPEVLTVGVLHNPPFQIVGTDGRISGLEVEVLRDLADLADLDLRFVAQIADANERGPGPSRVDMTIRALGETDRPGMQFTRPIDTAEVALFGRTGGGVALPPPDWRGKRIGIAEGLAEHAAATLPRSAMLSTGLDGDALAAGLLDGRFDAVMARTLAFDLTRERLDRDGVIRRFDETTSAALIAPALRAGLSNVREELNVVIPAYLASDRYEALRASFLEEIPFWTTERLRVALFVLAGALAALTIGFLWVRRAERLRAELAETRLLADVTRNLPHDVIMLGPSGQTIYSSAAGRESTGMNPGTGGPGSAMLPASVWGDDQRIGAAPGLTEDKSASGSAVYSDADGRQIKRIATPMTNGNMLLLLEDVSEDRRIRSELAAQKDRLAAVMDAAHSGIVGLSPDGEVALANPRARGLLGIAGDDLPVQWPANLRFLSAQSLSPLSAGMDPVARALAGDTLTGETFAMSGGDDDPAIYLRLSSARIGDERSPDVAALLIMDDVTEQERHRQNTERASRLDALGKLTGGIAHDFNNLLAAISYSVELADMAEDDETRKEYLDIALDAVDRGGDTTARLLSFAKRQPGSAVSVSVTQVMTDLMKLVRPTIEESIHLDFRFPEPDLRIYCDAGQLENALLNLVLNSRDAIRSSGHGSRISISARARIGGTGGPETRPGLTLAETVARSVDISVTDDGPGMSAEIRRRATDPFFTTKPESEGTGLGLAMAYGFAEQAGGLLRLYSEVGQGTTVTMRLPRATSDGDREPPVPVGPVIRGSGETVLIVEDEPAVLRTMRDIIANLGYRVIAAGGTEQALDTVRSGERVDLLLTDVVMPGPLDGYRLAEEVASLCDGVRVMYMSGFAHVSYNQAIAIPGPFVQKPIASRELAALIASTLSARTPAKAN